MMCFRNSSTSLLLALAAYMVISVSFSADIQETKTIQDGESTRYDDNLQYRLKRQTKNEFNSMQIRAPTKRQQMIAALHSSSTKPGMAFVKKDNSVSVSEPALNPSPDRAFSFPMPAEPASPVALHHRAFNFPGVDPHPDHGGHTGITASQNQDTSAKIDGTSNLDVLTKLSAPVTEQSQGTSSQNAMFKEIRKAILSHHARELLKSVMKSSPSFNSQPDLFEPRTPGTLSAGHLNYLQIRNRPLHFDRQRKPEPTNTFRNDVPEIQAGLVDVTQIEPQVHGNQDTFLNSHHEGSFSSSMMGMPLNHPISEGNSAFRIATSRVFSPVDLQPTSNGARKTGIATSGQSSLRHVGIAHGHAANQPFLTSNSHQTHRMETHAPHDRVHTVVATSTTTPSTSTTTQQPTTTKATATTTAPPSPSTTTTSQLPTAPKIGTINLNGNNPFQAIDATVTTSSSTPQSSVPHGMHISTSTNKPTFPASSGVDRVNIKTQGNAHPQVSPPHHPIINLHINFHQPTHQQPSNMAVQQHHPPQSNAQFVASGQHNSPQHIGLSRMMVPNQPNQPMIDMNVIHNITQAVVSSWLRKRHGSPVMQTHPATNINSISPVQNQQQNNNVVRAGLVSRNAVSPNRNAVTSGPVNNNAVTPGSANQNSAVSGSTNQFPLPNSSSSSIHSSIGHASSTAQNVLPHYVPAGAKTSGNQMQMSSPPHNINQQKQAHTSTVATPTVPQHHSKSNHVELNPTNTVTKPSTGQHIATSQQKSNIFQRNGNVNTAPAPIRNQQAASNANIQNSIPSTTNQKLFMSPTSGIHSTANSQTGTHVTTGNTSNIPSQTNTKMVSGTKVSNSMQGNQQGPQSTNAHNAVNTQQSERHSTASSQTSTHVTIGNTSNIPSQTNTKMVTGTRVSNSMQGNQKGSQSTNFQHVGNTQQTSSQPQPPLRETGNIHGPTTVLTSQSAADMGILMPQMLRGVHANPNGQHAAVPNIPIHHSQNQPQNLQSNIGPHVTSQQNNHVKVGNSQQVFAGAQHNGNIQNLPGSVSSSPNMQTLNLNMASMEMSALPHQPSNLASQVSSVSTSTSSQTSLSRESNSGTSHLPQPSGNTAHQSNTIGTPSTLQMSLQGTQSQTMMKSVSQQQSNGNTAGSQTLPQVSTNNARQITTLHLGQTSGHNSGHNSGTHSFMNSPGHLHPISTSSVPKASHNAVSHSSSQAQQSNVPHQSLSRSQTQSHSKMQGNQQLAGHQGIPEIMNSATHVEVISQKSSSQPQASNTSPNAMTMTTTGKAQQITERQNIMPHQSSSKSQQFNTVPASPSELLSSQSIRSNAGTGSITHQQTSTPIQFQSVASVMKPQPLGSQSVVNPTQLQSGTIASKTSLVSTNGHGSSQDTGSQTNPHIITQHSSNMIQQLNTVSTSKNREAPQNINIPVHLNGASVSSSGHVTSTNAVGNTGISSSSQKSNTTPSHVNSVHSSSNAQMPIGSHNIAHPVNVAPINEQMLQNTNIQTVMNNLPQHSSNSVQQVNTVSKSSMGTHKSLPNLPNGISRQVNSASAQMNEKLPLQNLGGITGVSKSPQQSRDIPPSQFNTVSFSSQTQQLGSQAQTRNSPQQIRDIPPSQFNTWSSSSQTQQQPGSRTPTDSLPQQPSNVVEQFNSVSRSVNGHTLQTTVPEKAERHPSLRNTHNIDQMTALTGQQQLSSQSAGQPPNNLNNQPSGQSNQGPSQSVQQSTFSSHTASQGIIGHQSNMLSSQNIQHNPSNVETSITTHTNTPPSQTKSPHSLMNGDMAITNHRNTNQQQTTNQKSNQQSNNHAVNGQSTHTITKPGTPSSSRVSSQPANIQNAFQEHLGGGQGQVSQNNQGQTLSAKSFTSRTTLRRQEFPQNNQQLTNNQGRHTPATTRSTQNIQQTNLIEQPIVNNFKQQSNSSNHITKQSGAQDKLMNSQHTKVQPQSAGHQRNTLQASPNSSPSNQVNTIHEQLSSGHHGNSMPSQTSVNQGWLTLDQTMNQQNNLHHFSASKQMSSGVQSNTISSTPVEKINPMNSQSSGISQLPVQVGQHNQKSTVSSQQITQVVTNKEPTGSREMQHRGHGNTITKQTKIPSTKNQPVQQGNTVHRSHSSSTGHNSNVNAIQNTANGHTKEFTGTSNVFASSNGQVFSPSSGSQTVMNSISQQSRNTPNSSGGQTSVVSSTKSNAPKVNTSPVSQNGILPPSATLVQSSVNSLSFDIGSTAQTLKNGKMIENTHLSNNQVQPEINQISKIQVKRIDSKLGRTSQSQAVTQTGQVNSQIGQLSPSSSQTSQHMPITAGHQAAVSVQLTGRPKPVHKSHSKRVQQQKSAGHIQGQVGQQIGTKSHMQKNIPSPPKDQLVHQTQRQTAGVNSNRNPGQFSGQQSTVQSQQQTAKQMVGQGNTGQHQTVQSNGSPVQNTKTQVNGHARQSSSSQSTRTSSQLLQGQSNGATGQYTHAQNTATTGHKPQSPGQPNQTTTAQSKHQSNPPSTNTHENFIGELNAQKSSGPAAKVNITSQQVRSTSNLEEKPTSPNSNTRMTGSPTATHWSALTPGDTLFPFQNLQHSSPIGWVSPIVSDFNRNVQLQNSPPEVLSSSTSRISTAQVGKSQKNSPKAASGSITAQKPNTETKAMNQAQQTSNTQSAGQTQSSIIKKNVQPVASLNKMPKKANSNTIALNQHNQPNIITTVSMGKSPNQKQTSSQGVSHDITSTLRISPSMAPPSGQPSKIPNNPTTPGKHVLRIVNNALSSTGSSNTLTNVHQANNIEVSGSQGRTTNHQHKSVPSGTTPQLSQRNTNHFGNGISTSQHNQQIHAPTPQSVSIGKRQNSLPKKSATSKTVLPQTSVVVQQNAQTHGASPHRQHGHPASQTSGQSNRHSSVHMVSQNGKNTIQPASTKATSQTTTNQPIHPTKFHREIAQSGQQTNSPTMTQRRMAHNAHPSNSLESSQMEMIQNSQMTQSQMRTHQNGLQPSNPVSSKTGASQNWLQPITSSQMGSVQTFQHSIDPTSSSTRTSSQSVRNSKPSSFQMPNSQVGQTHASFTMGTSQINQRFNQPVSSSTNQMSTQMKQLNHVPSSQNGFSSVKQSKIKPPTTQTATRSHVSTHLIQHGAKQSQVDTQQNRQQQPSKSTPPKTATSMHGHHNEKRKQRNDLLQRGSKTLHVVRQPQNSPTTSTGMSFIHPQPNTVSSQTHASQPRISSSSQQRSVATLGTKSSTRSQQNSPRPLTQFSTSQTGQQQMREASSQIGLTQPAIQTNPTISTNLLTNSMTRNTIVRGQKQGSNRPGASSSTHQTRSQPTADPTGNRGTSRQLSPSDMLSSSRPLTSVPNNHVNNRKLVPTVQSNTNPSLNQRFLGNFQLQPTHISASRGITNTAYSNTELGVLSPNLHLQDVALTDFAFMHPTGGGNGDVNTGTHHGTTAPFIRSAVVVEAPYTLEVSTVKPTQPFDQISVVVSEQHRPSKTTFPSSISPTVQTVFQLPMGTSHMVSNSSASNKTSSNSSIGTVQTISSSPDGSTHSVVILSASTSQKTAITTTPAATTNKPEAKTNTPVSTTKVPASSTIKPVSTSNTLAATTQAPASTTNKLVSTTYTQVATTNAPESPTKVPTSTTKIPTSITKSPAAATKSPAFTTKIPTSITKEPAATIKEPVATTNVSSSTLKIPASTTKAPAATTKSPAFTTNKTVSANDTPAATNNAPATTTKTPASKTKMSASITKAPVATTKVPSATTKVPSSTTKIPASTTKAPASKTKMSASTTKAPVATTKVPSATTKVPSSTTKIPTSITNTPAATTKSPAAANKSPAFTTKIPTSIAKAPAATTKEPVATTNVSSSTLKIPASTTKAPAATTKSPAFTTNKTVSANNTPAATNNAPATTTKTPASKTKMSASTTKAPVATTKVPSSTTKIPASTTKAPAAKTKAPAATTQTTHSSMTTSQAFTSTSPAVKGGVTTAPSSTFSPDIIGGSRTVTIPTTVSLSTNTIPIEASANHGSTNVNIEHFNSPMIVVPEKVRPSVLPDAVSSLDATSKATVTPLHQLSSIPTNQVIATGIGGTSYEVLTSKPTSSPSKRVEQGYKLHGGLHKILNISNTDKSTLSYSNNPTAMDVKSIPVDVNNMPQITTLNTNSVSKEAQNPMHAYPLLSRSANATLITKNEIQHISNSQKGTTAEKDNLTYPKQTKTARTTNPFAALDEKAVDSIASRILTSLVKMVGRQTANDIHQNSINDKNSFTENNDKTTKLERKDQLSAEITRRLSTSLEQLSLNGKLNLESPSPQVMPVVKNIDALNNSVPQKTKKPRIPTPTQMSTHQETTTIQQPPIQPVKHMQENRFSAATQSVTISNEVLPKLATQPSSQQLPVKTEQNPGNQQDMRAPKKATVLLDATETAPASATMTLSSQGLETHTPVAHLSKLNLQDRSNRGKAHHTQLPEVSAGGLNLDLASLLRLTTTTTASQKPTESSTISTNSVANKDISTQLSIKSTVASPLIANSRKSIGGSRLATVSQSSSNHHTAVSSAATKQLPSAKPVDPSIVPLKSTVQTSKSSPEVRIADNISYKHSVLAVTTTVSSVTGESLSKKLIVNLNDLINTSHPIAKDNYTSKITARQKLDISDLKANTFESLPLHSTVVKTTSTPSTRQDVGVTASTMPINLIKKSTAAPPLLATKSPQSVMQPSTSPSAIIAITTTGPIFHKYEDIKSKTEGSHSSVSTTTSRPYPRNAGQKTAATIPDNGRPIPNATDKGQSSKLAPSVVKIQTQENKSPGIGHDTTTPRSNIKEWEFAAISAGILKTTPSTNHEWLPHSFPVIPEVPKGLEFLSLQPRKERTSSNSLLRKLVLNSFKPEKQMQISKEGLLLSENSVITNNVVQPNKNVDLKQDLVTQHSNGMYSSKIRPTKSSIVQSNLQDPQLIQQLVYSRVNQSAARQVSPTSVSNVGYSLSESTNHLQSDHTDGTSHTLGRFNTKDLVNGISSNADMFKVLKNAVTKQDRMPGKTGTRNAETSLKQTKTVDNPAYKVNQIMYPRDISVPALEMIVDVPHGRLNPVKPTKPSHSEQVI